QAAERHERSDAAGKAFGAFLNRTAVPLFRQIANVLTAEKRPFSVSTPGESVRLVSDNSTTDYLELALEATFREAVVTVRTKSSRGRRVIETEEAVGTPEGLSEHDLLASMLKALEPFVER